MTIKVIGAGFGRTGTLSLKAALETLGFGPCYHMSEVFAHPEHFALWTAAWRGQPIDWDALFQGYQATVDWPGCTFYQELMRQYPDAKVLLSVRDPEAWYESICHLHELTHRLPFRWLASVLPRMRRMARVPEEIVWNGTFQGRLADRTFAIDVFNRHIAEVQRHVPPERLLVYNVRQGWEPLCRFLDAAVPQGVPFPHLNDRASTGQLIRQMNRRVEVVSYAALASVVLAVGWWVWRMQRRVG
jgi:hypothetical protein